MATREIVELPDRKSGDINEIRDKKIVLAKDATAQGDLPQQLEYLIKNGQTGEFMNVLDSYINEKIRSALGGLIASLDKGAAGTTKAIACIDTNNDLGIINPANLASVLGGASYPRITRWSVSVVAGTSFVLPIPSNVLSFTVVVNGRTSSCIMCVTKNPEADKSVIGMNNMNWSMGYSSNTIYGMWHDSASDKWYGIINVSETAEYYDFLFIY